MLTEKTKRKLLGIEKCSIKGKTTRQEIFSRWNREPCALKGACTVRRKAKGFLISDGRKHLAHPTLE